MTNNPEDQTKEPTDYSALSVTFVILGFTFIVIGLTNWAFLPVGVVFVVLGIYYQRIAKNQHDAKKRADKFAEELKKASEKEE